MKGTTIAHYKIIEKLAEGGMGKVYKAEDTRLGRPVALKFLASDMATAEEYKKRFEQEARAIAALNHPNICTIFSVEEHENAQFISMEYIEGTTLRNIIKEGNLDTEKAVDYGIQIAAALSAAHKKGIIHRDLKPENIMINNDGQIKVMDFGLARINKTQHITRKKGRLGTIAYMSPEQIRGEEVDLRSDLFSFGIILCEMLADCHPFHAEYEQALSYRLLNEDPSQEFMDKHLSPRIKKVILRCLEKEKQDRYSSAEDIKNELKRCQRQPSELITISNNKLFPSFLRASNHNSLIITGVLVLVVVLFAGTWMYNGGVSGGTWKEIPDEKHLAVLPFNNLSEEAIPASFNDGIMEILTSKITQMGTDKHSLWVVPTSEVRDEQVSSVTEARELFAVNMAVTGSLYRDGDQFQLTINLVDGATMRQLRSSVLELEWTDFEHLQDEVVSTLANMLEIPLEPETKRNLTAGDSHEAKAYRLFIEGRGFLSRYEEPEAIDKAIEKFEEALDIDSNYALAWAGIAEAYWRKFTLTSNIQWTEPALEYARKALELNDEPPEIYVTLAMIYNGIGRHKDALDLLKGFEQEEPGFETCIQLAKAYSGLDQIERAEEEYLKAINLKETYWKGYSELGIFYYLHGRYKEAVEMFEEVTEWTPDSYSAFYRLGAGYFELERNGEAEKAFKKSLELRENYRALSNLGTLYFHEGKYPEAMEMFERALEMNDKDYLIWGNLGFAYHWMGESQEKVFSTLNKAIELADSMREVTPDNSFLLAQLANYYALTDNVEQVRYLLGQLIAAKVQDPEIMIMIAGAYAMLNEQSAAISWTENALEQGYGWDNIVNKPALRNLLENTRMKNLQENYEQ